LGTSAMNTPLRKTRALVKPAELGSVHTQVIEVGWYVVFVRFVILAEGTTAGAVVEVLVTQVVLITPTGPSVLMLMVYAVKGFSPVFAKVCTPLATSTWNTPSRKTRALV
jgi:hypothetical protein